MDCAKKNLSEFWKGVSDVDLEIGKQSYPSYQKTLRQFAEFYGTPFIPTVEAFVALSPNNDYHGNLRSLASVLWVAAGNIVPFSEVTISTYRACGERALGYLSGEVSFLDTVGGLKIRAFRDNILYLEKSRRVTVDGHMVAICSGTEKMTMKEAAFALNDHLYRKNEKAILSFARSKKIAPCDVQATMWVSRKRRLGIKMDTTADMFTGKSRWDGVLDPMEFPPFQHKEWRNWIKETGRA